MLYAVESNDGRLFSHHKTIANARKKASIVARRIWDDDFVAIYIEKNNTLERIMDVVATSYLPTSKAIARECIYKNGKDTGKVKIYIINSDGSVGESSSRITKDFKEILNLYE